MYRIDDVPIPRITGRHRSAIRVTAEALKVGQSFAATVPKSLQIVGSLNKHLKPKRFGSYVIRVVDRHTVERRIGRIE